MAKDWMLAHSGKGIGSSSDFLSSTANEMRDCEVEMPVHKCCSAYRGGLLEGGLQPSSLAIPCM